MNSFGTCFFEETASRVWPTASTKIGPKLASAPRGIQAFLFHDDNKIKAIADVDKYFLTISNQQFGTNEYGEPGEWLR